MSARSFGSGSGMGQRRLAVEQLERRSMLAGNVNAFVDGGGNLIVRGNNSDNAVLIQQVDDGEYVVIGLDFDDFASLPDFDFQSGPTNISGGVELEEDVHLFTGVTGNIDVDLKKGDDILAVGNSTEDLDQLGLECLGLAFGSGSGSGDGTASGSQFPVLAQQGEPTEGELEVP